MLLLLVRAAATRRGNDSGTAATAAGASLSLHTCIYLHRHATWKSLHSTRDGCVHSRLPTLAPTRERRERAFTLTPQRRIIDAVVPSSCNAICDRVALSPTGDDGTHTFIFNLIKRAYYNTLCMPCNVLPLSYTLAVYLL